MQDHCAFFGRIPLWSKIREQKYRCAWPKQCGTGCICASVLEPQPRAGGNAFPHLLRILPEGVQLNNESELIQ